MVPDQRAYGSFLKEDNPTYQPEQNHEPPPNPPRP